MSIVVLFYVFFFQAEDGIRDTSVTGVQTCALPICTFWPAIERYGDPRSLRLIRSVMAGESPSLLELDDRRSEEHTSELQSPMYLVCRLLLEKKNTFTSIALSNNYAFEAQDAFCASC